MTFNLVTILGPTATGKTKLASFLASQFNGEIISADSRQVYKNMNIGTGKDYEDYIVNNNIPVGYYLIDIADPSEEYNVYRFKEDFIDAYNNILAKKKFPFLCGGTGLYISAVIQNYLLSKVQMHLRDETAYQSYTDDELRSLLLNKKEIQHNITDLSERQRIVKALLVADARGNVYADTSFIKSFNIGINPGREIVKKRITQRLKLRLKNGMIEEVENLIKNGISLDRLLLFGLEYKYVALYLSGGLNYNDMFQKLESAIHHFSKRQMTWFRKMEKEGIKIHWLDSQSPEAVVELIQNNVFT